ncbi:hypothetical protein NBRC116494_22760 [Aurantivibrio plasticivorans]
MHIGQSHFMSVVESTVSVLAGYLLNVLIQFLVYPLFGIEVAIQHAFIIAIIITGLAFVKNYSVRRLFNRIHVNQHVDTSAKEL